MKAVLKHSEKLNTKKIRLISLISFFMGFCQAFFIYEMSSYFKKVSGDDNVGAFYFLAYAITLTCLLFFHKFIKKFSKADALHLALCGKIFVIIALLFYPSGLWAVILMIFYIIFGNLEWVSLDIILESYSKDNLSGRIRGKFLTITNAGFLIAPFLSSLVLEKYQFYGVILVLLVMNIFILFLSIFNIHSVRSRSSRNVSIKDMIKKVFDRKDIHDIFYISFVLEFFYALMVIYTPIYLINLGYEWDKIGIIFTAMLLPFVLLQYPAGILADKKMGEKELLIFSLIIMGLSTIAIFFISTGTILIWSIVLFSTRIGAALVEIMRDSYFYKRIDGDDVELIDFFRTTRSLAYIIASIFSAFIIYAFSLKAVFILIGAVVLSALFPAFMLVDNESEKEVKLLAKN